MTEYVRDHLLTVCPEWVEKADAIYDAAWRLSDEEELLDALWNEALASAINQEMIRGAAPQNALKLFGLLARLAESGDSALYSAIDVGVVENMFWDVSPESARPYWQVLPDSLRKLYLGFHSRPPC